MTAPESRSTAHAEARRFGAWVFVAGDALLFAALLFLSSAYGTDARVAGAPQATLPWLATGCVVIAALFHRAHARPLGAALALAAAIVLLALFWRECERLGYEARVGRHAYGMHLLTRVWAVHVAGALVALGLGIVRREPTRTQPVLRVFLPFLAVVGAAVSWMLF